MACDFSEQFSKNKSAFYKLSRVQAFFGGVIFPDQQAEEEGGMTFTSLVFLLKSLHPVLAAESATVTQIKDGKHLLTVFMDLETGQTIIDKRPVLRKTEEVHLVDAETRTRKQALFALFALHSDEERMEDQRPVIDRTRVTKSQQLQAYVAANKAENELPYANRSSTKTLMNNIDTILDIAAESDSRAQLHIMTFLKGHVGKDAEYTDYLIDRLNLQFEKRGSTFRYIKPNPTNATRPSPRLAVVELDPNDALDEATPEAYEQAT